jgi:hypothetical protein
MNTRETTQNSCEPERDALDKQTDLKLEINRLIWQYSPSNTTLEEAETVALKCLSAIENPKGPQ